jgi:hypothetical protein
MIIYGIYGPRPRRPHDKPKTTTPTLVSRDPKARRRGARRAL